jgi:hypothetical protein
MLHNKEYEVVMQEIGLCFVTVPKCMSVLDAHVLCSGLSFSRGEVKHFFLNRFCRVWS